MIKVVYHKVQTRRPDRLIIDVVLKSPEGSWWLGTIEQRSHVIYYFSDPFGYHFTYHDADAKHPNGRIHVRLDGNSGGRFSVWPGGADIGTEAAAWGAPPFQKVRDVLPLPPSPGIAFVPAGALEAGRRQSKSRQTDFKITIDQTSLQGGMLGFVMLALEPENKNALQDWLEERQQSLLLVVLDPVDIFDNFQPWLACVRASSKDV